jgi:hypothetical protein
MSNKIILTEISLEELKQSLRSCIKEEIAASKQYQIDQNKPSDSELLTIKEVAVLFKVSKVTIHSWIKLGILNPFKKNSRTYFLKSEIVENLSSSKHSNKR